jgi:hypothetical protein
VEVVLEAVVDLQVVRSLAEVFVDLGFVLVSTFVRLAID